MIIDLPGFNFEFPHFHPKSVEPLLDQVRQFLDKKGVNGQEYTLGSQTSPGMGELVLRPINQFWVVYTTERGTNFDMAIFTNEFHAINYFIFRLTREAETIDWSSV